MNKSMRTLINKIKQVREKVKNIFRVNKMGYKFPLFEVAEIEKDIDISKEAAEDGKNDIPRSDARTFSICENEAIAKCDALRQKEVSNAAEYLASIKNTIINQTAELGKKHFFINNIKIICIKKIFIVRFQVWIFCHNRTH